MSAKLAKRERILEINADFLVVSSQKELLQRGRFTENLSFYRPSAYMALEREVASLQS